MKLENEHTLTGQVYQTDLYLGDGRSLGHVDEMRAIWKARLHRETISRQL